MELAFSARTKFCFRSALCGGFLQQLSWEQKNFAFFVIIVAVEWLANVIEDQQSNLQFKCRFYLAQRLTVLYPCSRYFLSWFQVNFSVWKNAGVGEKETSLCRIEQAENRNASTTANASLCAKSWLTDTKIQCTSNASCIEKKALVWVTNPWNTGERAESMNLLC